MISQDGRGYGRLPGSFDEELTRVGPGTPAGELFRRYWLPIACSDQLGERPRRVRMLGEDLIAFRDGDGRPGLLHERCLHRGTSLYYSNPEQAGLRCCHHGWLYDVHGRRLDQPGEASGGNLPQLRQPWYPVRERYGLAFAFLGPADEQPELPRYDVLETEDDGYGFYLDGSEPYRTTTTVPNPAPYNWLQMTESSMDAAHVLVLHGNMGGPRPWEPGYVAPKVDWTITEAGMQYAVRRPGACVAASAHAHVRIYETIFPNIVTGGYPKLTEYGRSVLLSWQVPVDDGAVKEYTIMRLPRAQIAALQDGSWAADMMGTRWADRTEEERQLAPGDYEAQISQGTFSLHSHEHLTASDQGVVMYRNQLRENIAAVRSGQRPMNVSFSADNCTVHVRAGNYLVG